MKAEELKSLIGQEGKPSSWFEITQDRIDRFADATNDHQFIHVNPEKAALTPFGGTIAHGYLTLSLIPALVSETSPDIEGVTMGINYGMDKLRFIQPVKTGSRVRTRQKLLKAVERKPGHWMIKSQVTMDIENEEKPALIAETISIIVVN
ncbi:MaoC family dehydratase [Pseudomonadota bacterium]